MGQEIRSQIRLTLKLSKMEVIKFALIKSLISALRDTVLSVWGLRQGKGTSHREYWDLECEPCHKRA